MKRKATIPQSWSKEYKEEMLDLLNSEYIEEVKKDFQEEAPSIISIKETIEEAKYCLSHPHELDGISSGYDEMNRIIGGFGAGELHVIGGGTGQGKSLLTQSIALNMALSGIPVLLFTLEMLPKENTIRLLSMIKSRCNQDLLGELPLSYFHGDAVSLEILEKTVKKGVQDGVKVVIIDHLHFFARAVENQSSEIGNITRFIKLLARRYGVAIILVSHIRKINNAIAEPGLDDLRDSSFIAQDADSVMMVWRDMRNPNSDEFRKLKVYVKKNRRKGTLGNLMYYCDENYYLKEMNYECGSSY